MKYKFASAAARYVPSSLQEIQAGTSLEVAQHSRVSFNPDINYDESTAAADEAEVVEVGNNHRAKKKQAANVADVASALVVVLELSLFLIETISSKSNVQCTTTYVRNIVK